MTTKTSLDDGVAWMCAYLASAGISNGQLATLRKSKSSGVSPVAWWLLAQLETKKLKRQLRVSEQINWIELTQLLAIMTPVGSKETTNKDQVSASPASIRKNPHAPDIPLGRALFLAGKPDAQVAGYSELRLATLLSARNTQKKSAISRMCRFMAAKQQTFDCQQLAHIVFTTDPTQEAYDDIRQKIAADYYRSVSAANSNSDSSEVTA